MMHSALLCGTLAPQWCSFDSDPSKTGQIQRRAETCRCSAEADLGQSREPSASISRPVREPFFTTRRHKKSEQQIQRARDSLNNTVSSGSNRDLASVPAAQNAAQNGATDEAQDVPTQATSRFSPEYLASQCSQMENSTAVVCTDYIAETLLPTSSGPFRLRGYRHTIHLEDGTELASEPTVIMTGQPEGQENVVMRVHDACFTSEVLGSLKCDCADQLQLAMDYIQENPGGLIVYLQQEGRGIGLANKIAAYALQEKGVDTVDANRQLGLPDDAREYTSVRNILVELGIKSVRLMTNNPRKISELERLGIKVTSRIPCIVQAQKHNLGYLSTKRSRMDHLFGEDSLDGSFCYWDHSGEPVSVHGPKQDIQVPLGKLVDEEEIKVPRRSELKDIQEAIKKQAEE